MFWLFAFGVSSPNTVQKNYITDSALPDTKDLENIHQHSQVFNRLILQMKNDGYEIDTISLVETIFNSFARRDGFSKGVAFTKGAGFNNTLLQCLSGSNVKQRYYKLKRKHPSADGGKTYPRFNLTELCFIDKEKAKTIKPRIDSIIDCTNRIDLRNEKRYDHCIQFSNRIIYVDCNSMYLSTFSDNYKSVIKELIKQKDRYSP